MFKLLPTCSNPTVTPSRNTWALDYTGQLYLVYFCPSVQTNDLTWSFQDLLGADIAVFTFPSSLGSNPCQPAIHVPGYSATCQYNNTGIPAGVVGCYTTTFSVTNKLTSSFNQSTLQLVHGVSSCFAQNILLQACSSPTSNNVPVNPSSGVYNTQANFSCPQDSTLFNMDGTTGNTATKCLATAEWENEKIVQCWSANPTLNLPSPGNTATRALGITNLTISTTISTTLYNTCAWSYRNNKSLIFYAKNFGRCLTPSNAEVAVTCTDNGGTVTSQLRFIQAINASFNVTVDCDITTVSFLTVIIQACSSPTPSNVPVNPSSGVYNTQANFQCSHGSTLFYVNGTTGNNATKCLATAEWENEKIVQCWSAPTATLIGNNTICAGNIATFQCNATGGVPSLDRVEIYFNNPNQTLVGNTWTSNPLSSSNNGDIVECRAINSYTAMQEYANLGRDSKTLIIHYAAEGFAVNDGTTSHSNICTWYIAPPGPRSCTITFSLNPTTYTTTLIKDGAMVTNDAINQPQTSTSQTFVFTRNQPSFNDSGNYTLRINNGMFENTFTFNILVINEVQPTPTPPIPQPDNLGVIIGAAVGGVVAFILIIILVVYCLRQQNNKQHKDKEVTGRSNIGMEAEHGYYEIADRSPYQNEQVTNNIPATQSTNYENLKDNVNVTRDEQGYADIQSVGPRVVTTPNEGYETFIGRKYENMSRNQQNESGYEHMA
uniref:uncharacterized protein LOC104265713 isoform X2 n=1 Tax=Ciona intestinalis TaxID=7719 RepID=UPI00089DBD32|nr:uncharacterized protein LOC104265713 isoform X2 [Ciona intestinalis]|eukprot:XP_018672153.1 uncharacterized protein LOC104265713 isoform X2 [Ciona intestinalis]